MITVVLGTKAQLIKMAPVMLEFERRGLEWQWIFTGQHRETIADLQRDFGLRAPDHQLYDGKDIVRVRQMLWWSLRILWIFWRRRKTLLPDPKHSIVVVHGDTISTVIGALAGRLVGSRVAHIESGLTSKNLMQPFPEELQRRIVFRLANIFFCPGEWAIKNIEHRPGKKINTIHNTLLDSLALIRSSLVGSSPLIPFFLVNFHRFENLRNEQRMRWIVEHIEIASQQHHVVIVLHQPTEQALKKFHLFDRLRENPHVTLKPRQTYIEFIRLLINSELLMTDGGSNQEECYYLGHPCLLFRDVTERQEGVGQNVILSTFDGTIFSDVLANPEKLRRPAISDTASPSRQIGDWFVARIADPLFETRETLSIDTRYWMNRHSSTSDPLRSVGCRSLRPAANQAFYHRVSDVLRSIVDQLRLPQDSNVLDAGAGIGMYEPVLLERGWHVTATDVSSLALEKLQHAYPSVHTTAASIDRLPFADRSFQMIMCFDVLYHITNRSAWEQSIQELCRTANEYIILHGVWSDRPLKTKQHVRQRPNQVLLDELRRAGFQLVNVQPTVRNFNFPWYFLRNIFPLLWYRVDSWQRPKSDHPLRGHAIAVFRRQDVSISTMTGMLDEDFTSKYTKANWIHRRLLNGYFRGVQQLIGALPSAVLQRAVEIGCGAGFSTERLRSILPPATHFEASEYLDRLVVEARQRVPNVDITQEDIYHLHREARSVDLLFALEVLEHLDRVPAALAEIRRVSRYAIIGVPNEPWWRILNMTRGKYLRHLGNTPGHINHWSGRSLIKMLEVAGFEVVAMRSPLPWTLVLVRSKSEE